MFKIKVFIFCLFSVFLSQITLANFEKSNIQLLPNYQGGFLNEETKLVDYQELKSKEEMASSSSIANSCEDHLFSMLSTKIPLKATKLNKGYSYLVKDIETGRKEIFVYSNSVKVKSVWRVKLVNDIIKNRIERPVKHIGICNTITQGEFYVYKTSP